MVGEVAAFSLLPSFFFPFFPGASFSIPQNIFLEGEEKARRSANAKLLLEFLFFPVASSSGMCLLLEAEKERKSSKNDFGKTALVFFLLISC